MVTHLSMKMVPLIEKNLRIRMNLEDKTTVQWQRYGNLGLAVGACGSRNRNIISIKSPLTNIENLRTFIT